MFPQREMERMVDREVWGLTTIDSVHRMVHKGRTFQASYKSPEGADIADNGNVTFLIKTGGREVHFAYSPAAGGDTELVFYEETTVSSNGTSVSRVNMNRRNSIFVPSVLVFHTPTVTGLGTLLQNILLPGGAGNPAASTPGGAFRSDTEWELKENTNYIVRIINRAGSAQPMSIGVQWYEIDENEPPEFGF